MIMFCGFLAEFSGLGLGLFAVWVWVLGSAVFSCERFEELRFCACFAGVATVVEISFPQALG